MKNNLIYLNHGFSKTHNLMMVTWSRPQDSGNWTCVFSQVKFESRTHLQQSQRSEVLSLNGVSSFLMTRRTLCFTFTMQTVHLAVCNPELKKKKEFKNYCPAELVAIFQHDVALFHYMQMIIMKYLRFHLFLCFKYFYQALQKTIKHASNMGSTEDNT